MKKPKRQSLYSQVAESLRDKIRRDHKPGDRLPSISTMTRIFSVSEMALRPALAILEVEGLIELRQGSGCYVCEVEDDRHVAILVEMDILSCGSYFHGRVVQQLRMHLKKHGIRSRLYIGFVEAGTSAGKLTCDDFLEDIEGGKICAVAAITTPTWSRLKYLTGVPLIGSDRAPDLKYSVDLDHNGLIQEGVDQLLNQGRKKIAMLAWHPEAKNIFKAALARHSIPYKPEWVGGEFYPYQKGAGWSMFREIWASSDSKPDGLLVCDDVLLQDAKTAIIDMQINVPNDLFVVSHANKGSHIHCPFNLTRLETDPAEFAREMGNMVLKVVNRQPVDEPDIIIPFRVQEETDDTNTNFNALLAGKHETANGRIR